MKKVYFMSLLLPSFLLWSLNSMAQSDGDYRTIGAVDFASAQNWEKFNAGSWVAATVPPTFADGQITISVGTTATIGSAVTLDQLVINGSLTLLNNFTLSVNDGTGIDLLVNGTFTNNGMLARSGSSTYSIGSGGKYIHNSSTNPVANTWVQLNSNSTFEYQKSGFLAGIIYGNIVFNSNNSFTASGASVMINGNMSIEGTTDMKLIAGTGSNVGFNVAGNLSVNGSASFTGNSAGANLATLNIGGSISGNFNAGTGSGGFILNFTGGSPSVTFSPTSFFVSNGNVSIAAAKTVILANDIKINPAHLLTLNGNLSLNGNTATIEGGLSGTGSLKGSSTSNLSIGGSGSLGTINFDQATDGTTNTLNNFTLNRTSGTATLGNKLVVLNTYTPTAGVLTTANNLVLRSTATKTARVAAGDVAGGYFSGPVTIERFIAGGANDPAIPTYHRAFRFLSHPFTGNIPLTQLTDNIDITGSGGAANGFTNTVTNNPSAYWYNPAAGSDAEDANGQGWAAYTNTNGTAPNTWDKGQGIRVLVRGAKTEGLDGAATYTQSPVTLNMLGTLNTGNQTIPLTSNATSKYSLVGNPFASPIDLKAISSTNVGNAFYVWDLSLGGGKGGYTTIDRNDPTPYTLPAYSSFFATSTGSGSQVVIEEADKSASAPTSQLFKTTNTTNNTLELLLKTGNTMWDVFALKTHTAASAGKDSYDALKLYNPDANLYSVATDLKEMAIDYRNLQATDVVKLAMYTNQPGTYTIHANEAGLTDRLLAYLKDKFTNQVTPLTEGADYTFSVTSNPASQGENRFELTFAPNTTLPVLLANVQAYQKAQGIQLDWSATNEMNIDRYEVQRSANASNYSLITALPSANGVFHQYTAFDASPLAGNNFYRLKIIDKSGAIKFSQVMKVNIARTKSQLSIYPNPVVGKQVSIEFSNMDKGSYTLSLVNSLGQKVYETTLEHAGGSGTQLISLDAAIPKGIYQVRFNNPKSNAHQTVFIQ